MDRAQTHQVLWVVVEAANKVTHNKTEVTYNIIKCNTPVMQLKWAMHKKLELDTDNYTKMS
jgi:hypothetical protein